MEHDLGADLERLAHIVRPELRRRVDIVAATRAEVVEDDDLVAPCDERVDEVGADEPGPAGDERAHRGRLDG